MEKPEQRDIEWTEYHGGGPPRLRVRYIPPDMTLSDAVEAWREARGGIDADAE